MTCQKRGRPMMKAYNSDLMKVVYFRPRCKMWDCPTCAAVNTSLWRARAMFGAGKLLESGDSLNFLTLTSHERLTASQSLYVWPKAWAKLHNRAKYKAGAGAYMMIPERHTDGRLHMHALCNWNMSSTWWSDNARKSGLGYMAESEETRTPTGAGMYVTKYLAKSLDSIQWNTSFRRIRMSKRYPRQPERDLPAGWTFRTVPITAHFGKEVFRKQIEGFQTFVLDHKTAWSVIDALDNDGEFPEVDLNRSSAIE